LKILLTGVTGYVGSELLLALHAHGHETWCVTRSGQLAAGAPAIPAPRIITHDLRQPLPLNATDFDLVLHAAGANDMDSRDPARALDLTTLTARHCADFAVRQRSPRLLYLSTFQVYGTDQGEVDESTPCKPTNDYALTHLFAEQWIARYGRTHGLRHLLARPANIAGVPRSGTMKRWSLAPGCFCREASTDRHIRVRSSGLQRRDFLPLAEVASRIALLAGSFDEHADGPVNICAGSSLSIADLARLAAERYRHWYREDCALTFEPDGKPAPVPLRVGSRQIGFPVPDQADVRSLMQQCIDDTYHYLQRLP
jgi:UDP-glucose 4-epimerase